MNKHEFQMTAKKFRAGRITLEDFADLVYKNGKAPAPEEAGVEPSSGSAGADSSVQPPSDRPKFGGPRPRAGRVPKSLRNSAASAMPARQQDAHKGDFGRVLVIGGSSGMAGAISLTGLAALRSGSGLVRVATPDGVQSNVAQFSPCYMTVGCTESKGRFSSASLDELIELAEWADVIAVGPGMGTSKSLQKIMKRLYQALPQPMVIDADGLNNLAKGGVNLAKHEGQRLLTPHPGELQRLINSKLTDRADLEKRAINFAVASNVTLVVKGHRTLITDGDYQHTNTTGNPGMATAGSGDVLTGVIASLIGQGLSLTEAARVGVEVHGRAGDIGAEELGQVSLISTDILEFLPRAFCGA